MVLNFILNVTPVALTIAGMLLVTLVSVFTYVSTRKTMKRLKHENYLMKRQIIQKASRIVSDNGVEFTPTRLSVLWGESNKIMKSFEKIQNKEVIYYYNLLNKQKRDFPMSPDPFSTLLNLEKTIQEIKNKDIYVKFVKD